MGKGSKNIIDDNLDDTQTSKITPSLVVSSNTNLNDPNKTFFTWSQVKLHNNKNDCWIVIKNNVYNLTSFKNKHPGGSKILNHYAGQDATEVFNAFHKEFEKVNKYAKLYHIGRIDPNDTLLNIEVSNTDDRSKIMKEIEIRKDFENIKKVATELNLFKPSKTFFLFYALHIIFFQVAGYYILWNFGSSFFPCLCSLIFLIIAQGQSSWVQHDYGHSSIFAKPKYNRYAQMFFVGLIKGASSDWWRFMHNQHHAKPNVINQDPDVRIEPIFLLGKVQPVKKAEQLVKYNQKALYDYTKQHYIFPIAAPLLFPLFFQYTTIKFAFNRKKYDDLFSIILMFVIYFSISIPAFEYSISKSLSFYLLIRLVESAWFTWVAQCNHIVMDIHDDVYYDSWLHLQLKATCNINSSIFNDWFTGHLNFQIEHHLFPTMPRHNLYKIQPFVRTVCKKHKIPYVIKPLGQAFQDIIFSLKKSGEMWQEAYDELLN